MTIRGWPRLLLLCLATLGAFVAEVRLASIAPALWAPLVLIAALIACLVAAGVVAALLLSDAWYATAKRWNWHRWHAWEAVGRERARSAQVRGELARADTELRGLIQERDEARRTIAELSRDLNEAHATIRAERARALSNTP